MSDNSETNVLEVYVSRMVEIAMYTRLEGRIWKKKVKNELRVF